MSGLTTHILDTAHGRPAADMKVRLFREDRLLFAGAANADGRCPDMLGDDALTKGRYRLEFSVGDYFRGLGVELLDPPFLDVVAIDFGLADLASHYHVPLLVSPFSYSTYRGS